MIQALIRKARHVLDDPVLRKWLLRRMVGLENSPPSFVAGQPPYLGAAQAGATSSDFGVENFPAGDFKPPQSPIEIALPGQTVELSPENPLALFTQSYSDLETRLAAHRFAWVPIANKAVDPDWVVALWQAWADRFGEPNSDWPWHGYTTAERAINIIDFSRRFGLPGNARNTGALLIRHAETICGNLEYFGEHYTSNHLSNNGRGLLRIGTALERADFAERGAKIMVAEAGRIFGRSGVLREGSTHYHMLLTRNYIDAWLDAKSAGLEQATMLHDIAERALAVIPGLWLPGRLPLVGDISPDVPPEYLTGLLKGGNPHSWPSNLPPDRQREVRELIAANSAVSPDRLAEDGWHRFGRFGWQALTFVSPDGWPPMPGHGHQDLGSFELHDGPTPVIIDPGRGSYANTEYENAAAHSSIIVDGAGAMPVNRPYYSPAFRNRIISTCPEMTRTRDGQILIYDGSRHGSDIDRIERAWHFAESSVEICDRVQGRGRHRIRRQFVVAGSVSVSENCARASIGDQSYEISASVPATTADCTTWKAYATGESATKIMFDQTVTLPFEGIIKIDQH